MAEVSDIAEGRWVGGGFGEVGTGGLMVGSGRREGK